MTDQHPEPVTIAPPSLGAPPSRGLDGAPRAAVWLMSLVCHVTLAAGLAIWYPWAGDAMQPDTSAMPLFARGEHASMLQTIRVRLVVPSEVTDDASRQPSPEPVQLLTTAPQPSLPQVIEAQAMPSHPMVVQSAPQRATDYIQIGAPATQVRDSDVQPQLQSSAKAGVAVHTPPPDTKALHAALFNPATTPVSIDLTQAWDDALASATSAPRGVAQGAEMLQQPRLVYPRESELRGEQGTVLLRVEVSAEGRVTSVTVLKDPGYDRLRVAAIDAVRQTRFRPARRGGRSVESAVVIPIVFVLRADLAQAAS